MLRLSFRHMFSALLALVILFSTPFYLSQSISAHELTRAPWLTINGTDPLIYNPTPIFSAPQFEYGEKVIDLELEPGDELSFKVDADVIEDELGLTSDQLNYKWDFMDLEVIESEEFSISFDEVGNYFLVLTISRTDIDQFVFSDSMMIVVGTPEPAPFILFNGVGVSPEDSTVNRTFRISRGGSMLFAVQEPNTDKYSYEWDLADSDYVEGTEVSKPFENTKFPANIILRQTDLETGLISENYVILVSDDDPQFKVVRPAANELIPGGYDSNSNSIGVMVGFIALLILALIGLGLFNRHQFLDMAKRQKKTQLPSTLLEDVPGPNNT